MSDCNSSILSIFVREPEFVNEKGVKWWFDKLCTEYAQRVSKQYTVWAIEEPDGYRTRVLLDGENIIYEDQKTDGIGCHIDMLRICKKR